MAGSVNTTVVGEGGCGWPVFINAGKERIDHDGPGDGLVNGAGEEFSGVVIKPVQDFHVAAIAELPVGEVRLPCLVRLGCFKPDVRGSRSFPRFRYDKAGVVQDPPARRCRRWHQAFIVQVPGDRDGARI